MWTRPRYSSAYAVTSAEPRRRLMIAFCWRVSGVSRTTRGMEVTRRGAISCGIGRPRLTR